jgi:hypothetical protein
MFQNGGWPEIKFHKTAEKDELDIETDKVHRQNWEALVSLLRSSGEKLVEVYGIWDGDFGVAPQVREDISVESVREPNFYFKEKGFYKVHLNP